MKILELFSGTHSIGKVAKERGYDVVSLDLQLPALEPDNERYRHIKADIMTWDYKEFKEGHFDIITASPVCMYWSRLRLSNVGKKKKGGGIYTRELIDAEIKLYGEPMVDKVFEIIEYFKPKYWWIENPQSGRMKSYITDKPYYDVDYCQYSDWGYRKRTRIWSNIEGFNSKLCDSKTCKNMVGTQHRASLGGGYSVIINNKYKNLVATEFKKLQESGVKYELVKTNQLSKHKKYRIPQQLIIDLFDTIEKQ
jgi:site-specific DNA-cytosine methylase